MRDLEPLLVAPLGTRVVTSYPLEHRGATFKATEDILLSGRDQARPRIEPFKSFVYTKIKMIEAGDRPQIEVTIDVPGRPARRRGRTVMRQ